MLSKVIAKQDKRISDCQDLVAEEPLRTCPIRERYGLVLYEIQPIHMTLDCLIVFFTNYASCEILNIYSISATEMLIYTTWLV
jgi:hypothetical protein